MKIRMLRDTEVLVVARPHSLGAVEEEHYDTGQELEVLAVEESEAMYPDQVRVVFPDGLAYTFFMKEDVEVIDDRIQTGDGKPFELGHRLQKSSGEIIETSPETHEIDVITKIEGESPLPAPIYCIGRKGSGCYTDLRLLTQPVDEPELPTASDYPGCSEIVPGVFVAPGDAVYIADADGEIATWNADEVAEDKEAFTAALCAVALATSRGPEAVRANIRDKGDTLDDLINDTKRRQR